MKADENKSNEQEKISNRYQTMGMSMGMCFGISIGLAFGNLLDHGPIGMTLGMLIGMIFGTAVGAEKDKKMNEQLIEKGYKIIAISKVGEEKYEITVSDKNDNTKSVEIYKGDMEAEQFQIGDYIYIDEDGNVESIMDVDDISIKKWSK